MDHILGLLKKHDWSEKVFVRPALDGALLLESRNVSPKCLDVFSFPAIAPLKFRDNKSRALVAAEKFADILRLRVEGLVHACRGESSSYQRAPTRRPQMRRL